MSERTIAGILQADGFGVHAGPATVDEMLSWLAQDGRRVGVSGNFGILGVSLVGVYFDARPGWPLKMVRTKGITLHEALAAAVRVVADQETQT